MKPLSPALEELGFRLSLGMTEVDQHLTQEEIDQLETIADRYAGRRQVDKSKLVDCDHSEE
jgi:cob(I)alamin adenosyltransferase